MHNLTNEQIREIADQLDCGFRCFWNVESNEFIFVPDSEKHPNIEIAAWKAENDLLKKHRKKFKELEGLETADSFGIMERFVEQLPDKLALKHNLANALNNRKPFKHFKSIIDNSGEYRQQWFDFKSEWLQKWVKKKFNDLNERNDF